LRFLPSFKLTLVDLQLICGTVRSFARHGSVYDPSRWDGR
jgi:hypothetical protein